LGPHSLYIYLLEIDQLSSNMTPVITLEKLSFSYNEVPVISDINIQLNNQEIVSIVGPNGAGKTTLLKLIGGLLTPSQGTISALGQRIETLNSKDKAKLISIVPQNPRLPEKMKVLDFVMLGRNPHLALLEWEGKNDLDKAVRAMELTETYMLLGRELGQISGGELQRAMLAMAITQNSPIMLLDEPTSNLDLSHQGKVMDLIRNNHRQRDGATLIAIHDLTLAAQYTDRMILISEGRIFADGTPETVLTESNIEEAYGAKVTILSHPNGGSPIILPVAGEYPRTV